jgi:arginyl-tRNA synthetase
LSRYWVGPWNDDKSIKPCVIRRSDGTPTYAYHDLAFAKMVSPDFYVTGMEQKEHFHTLGLGQKHLPMGLVLDSATGKKLKSRNRGY